MSTVTDLQKQALEPILQALSEGITVERLDRFFDQMISVASEVERVDCLVVDGKRLRVAASGALLGELLSPLAQTNLRMLCARLATRFGAGRAQPLSPYGDEFELQSADHKHTIRFENTAGSQLLEIQHTPSG